MGAIEWAVLRVVNWMSYLVGVNWVGNLLSVLLSEWLIECSVSGKVSEL